MKLTEYSSQEITLNVQYIFQTIFTAKKVSTFINRRDSRQGRLFGKGSSFLSWDTTECAKQNLTHLFKKKKKTITVTNIHWKQADNKLVGHLLMVFLETTSQGYGIKDTGKGFFCPWILPSLNELQPSNHHNHSFEGLFAIRHTHNSWET